MAITLISAPNDTNSAYNPNIWIFNSNQKGNPGFRYVINVTDNLGTALMQPRVIAPRPVDGYCFIDLSKSLSDLVNGDINLDNIALTSIDINGNFGLEYTVRVQEEYNTNWSYSDTEFVSGDITKIVQFPNTAPHPFNIGDTIEVIPTDPNIRPNFNGLYTIIVPPAPIIPDSFSVYVNAPWMSTAANPGVIKFADNRKTRTSILYTSSTKFVYNSAIPFNNWNKNYFNDNYVPSLINYEDISILSNLPNGFNINEEQQIIIPIINSADEVNRVYFRRSDGVILYKDIVPFSIPIVTYFDITLKSGFDSIEDELFVDGISYYDVWVGNIDGIGDEYPLTKTLRINVNTDCNKTENFELLFEDRMGCYSSFAFSALSTKDLNVTKEDYNAPIKFDNNGEYDANTAYGNNITSIDFNEIYTLRTRAIKTSDEYKYFEELLTSPNVYFRYNGEYYRCKLITSSLNTSIQNGKLRYREIQVQLANKNNTNL